MFHTIQFWDFVSPFPSRGAVMGPSCGPHLHLTHTFALQSPFIFIFPLWLCSPVQLHADHVALGLGRAAARDLPPRWARSLQLGNDPRQRRAPLPPVLLHYNDITTINSSVSPLCPLRTLLLLSAVPHHKGSPLLGSPSPPPPFSRLLTPTLISLPL